MTATIDTPAATIEHPSLEPALARIDEAINELRNLRALIAERPDVARAVIEDLPRTTRAARILVYVDDYSSNTSVPERIVSLATAAADHGATVTQHHTDKFGGVHAHFGFVTLHVYGDLDKVGETSRRTEQVTVTDFQPHPALAAFAKEASK